MYSNRKSEILIAFPSTSLLFIINQKITSFDAIIMGALKQFITAVKNFISIIYSAVPYCYYYILN